MTRFVDTYFSREHRFSLGNDTSAAKPYASIPVSNGIVDYEEYYELSSEQFAAYSANPESALSFIDECRRHQHDDLLLQKPGWNRGTPV